MPVKLQLTPAACVIAAAMVLLLPLKWLLAAVLAAAWHELCHILALRLYGMKPRTVALGGRGAVICTGLLGPGQELICALVGPVGSLSLVLLGRCFPRLAVCGAIQGFYNLLPVYPLDGGRVLRCGTQLILPPAVADWVCRWIRWLCLLGVCLCGIYGTFRLGLGLLPLLPGAVLLQREQIGKFPCKRRKFAVQ